MQYQESYDNSGLLTGDINATVNGVLCTLDCTEAVIDEAKQKGCNLVVAHHPIVFKGLKSLTGKTYVERTMISAIKNDIAIYASHTNLDHAWSGVNRKIAQKLQLQNPQVLSPIKRQLRKLYTFVPQGQAHHVRQALFDAGAGHIGNYDHCSFNQAGTGTFRGNAASNPHVGQRGSDHEENETKVEVIYPFHVEKEVINALRSAHPYEEPAFDILVLENTHNRLGSGMVGTLETAIAEAEFLKMLTKVFHVACIRHTALRNKPIQKVALCGGAGQFLLPEAIRQGADIFISADFKYHEFFDAEKRIVIADIGHFESEQFTPELLKEILVEKFSTFAVLLSEVKTNPVHYFIS